MVAFLVTERRLRTDSASLSLKETAHDKGTTRLVGAALGASWVILALSLPANLLGIGALHPAWVFGVAGVALMTVGFALRTLAARTLGNFYSRTLRTNGGHKVVSEGLYSVVRHPGYLGMIALFCGACLTEANFVALILVPAIVVSAYIRRIVVEESMLSKELGRDYIDYMGTTKRLIPFIY